jgi:hypothetical protein
MASGASSAAAVTQQPSTRPTFRCRPERVSGIPICLERRAFGSRNTERPFPRKGESVFSHLVSVIVQPLKKRRPSPALQAASRMPPLVHRLPEKKLSTSTQTEIARFDISGGASEQQVLFNAVIIEAKNYRRAVPCVPAIVSMKSGSVPQVVGPPR